MINKQPIGEQRRSKRVAGIEAAPIFVDYETSHKISLGGAGDSILFIGKHKYKNYNNITSDNLNEIKSENEKVEIAKELSLKDTTDDNDDNGASDELFVSSLYSLAETCNSTQKPDVSSSSSSISDYSQEYINKMNALTISENNVAKVCSDRAYSITVLPSSNSIVAVVGDKAGNLGIWNYSSQHL